MGVSRRSVLIGAAATLVAANSFGRNNEIEDLVAQIEKDIVTAKNILSRHSL